MTDCCHYWKINSNGTGKCQKCGEEKQFPLDLHQVGRYAWIPESKKIYSLTSKK